MAFWRMMPFRIRWAIAMWIERRRPDVCPVVVEQWACWPHLVLLEAALDNDSACRREAEELGWCYCGKHDRKEVVG